MPSTSKKKTNNTAATKAQMQRRLSRWARFTLWRWRRITRSTICPQRTQNCVATVFTCHPIVKLFGRANSVWNRPVGFISTQFQVDERGRHAIMRDLYRAVKVVSEAVMLDLPWVSQKFTSHDDAFGRHSTSTKTNTSAKLYCLSSQ